MHRWLGVLLAVCLWAPCWTAEGDLDWWKTSVFYQIYPRSFQDSDGDGTGDLNGITAKLSHLKDLGVGGVWMSPMFKSPMADFGYDISDFYEIDPIFGTMEDFEALLTKANELDIKVILDFVPNHSSDESQWFIDSKNRIGNYTDYYVWKDKIGTNATGSPIPPTEWIGAFSESVWTWVPERGQFYYHRYNYKQPDFNYRDMNVRKEMLNILRFWLDKGVHGFRVDTIPTLVEDDTFPQVPDSEKEQYCINQPLTYEVVQEWRKMMDDEYTNVDGFTRVIMLEAFGTQEEVAKYYGNTTNPGAHFPFNFLLIQRADGDSKAQDIVDIIDEWVESAPNDAPYNWVIGNHDQHRVASRYGNELAAGIAMLSLILPGIGVIYNGEEIGMVNNMNISYEETLDPSGCNALEDGYVAASRDFERTPFQWDDTLNAGFSSAEHTWLPIHSNYKQLNLAKQKTDSVSYWHIYRRLMEARKTETIKLGSLTYLVASEHVVVVSRDWEGAATYMVVVNLGDNNEEIDLNAVFNTVLPADLYVYTSSVGSNHMERSYVPSDKLALRPKESLVLTSKNVDTSNAMPHQISVFLAVLALTLSRIFS